MTVPKRAHMRAIKIAMALTGRPDPKEILEATKYRNESWERAGITLSKSMDLYATAPDAAKACVGTLHDIMREAGRDPESYRYVEPSAGTGPFLEWLPDDTMAMDILPRHPAVRRGEFLTWEPPHSDRSYAVVGAPPLGHYSDVTVAFINRALSFADMVGMVVRHHVGNRQVRGRHLHTTPLDDMSVKDLVGGHAPYRMEWRVWTK